MTHWGHTHREHVAGQVSMTTERKCVTMKVLPKRRCNGFRFEMQPPSQLTTPGPDAPETKRACMFIKLKTYDKNETKSRPQLGHGRR